MNYCKKIIKKRVSILMIEGKLHIQRTKNVLNFYSLFFYSAAFSCALRIYGNIQRTKNVL